MGLKEHLAATAEPAITERRRAAAATRGGVLSQLRAALRRGPSFRQDWRELRDTATDGESHGSHHLRNSTQWSLESAL